MTGREFLHRLRRLGRERGVPVIFRPGHGKGSHGVVYYGDRRTTVKDRRQQIGKGLLRKMLADLGLTIEDLD